MTAQYKTFLIKKLKDNSPVKDSVEWNIMVKHIPFKVFPDMKDLPSHDWKNEHGDEEYIPDDPFYKAYEIECEFLFKGEHGTANTQIKDFMSYLAQNGAFSIYDTYTKIGRTNVRYVSNKPDIFYRRDTSEDLVIFALTLKVNDPITDIILVK